MYFDLHTLLMYFDVLYVVRGQALNWFFKSVINMVHKTVQTYLKQSSFDLLFNQDGELGLIISLGSLNVAQMTHSCHPQASCLLKFQFRIPVRDFK